MDLTRRQLLAIAGGAALTSVASGCGGAASPVIDTGSALGGSYDGPRVTISYWNGFTGGDGPAMRDLVDRFNSSQDRITVEQNTINWAQYYQRVVAAVHAGRGPDVGAMHLEHVVVTSVARDDLADGGSRIFAETILAMRATSPGMGVEVLIPDFDGSDDRLRTVMDARPDILNHNLETVKRLQKPVRKRARWDRSLYVLRRAKEMAVEIGYAVHTKSSLMVGLGETRDELTEAFEALRENDVDILTVGQYLRPSEGHLPLERYYHPDEFAEMKRIALALGFGHVESGPLVRSSYHAHEQADALAAARG